MVIAHSSSQAAEPTLVAGHILQELLRAKVFAAVLHICNVYN